MKTDTNNTVDLTSHVENIAKGEGFYSVFISEHQRNQRPARKSINGLKDLFVLLYNPQEESHPKEKSLNKLSQLIKRILSLYENSEPKDFLKKLKKQLFKVCDKIKSERKNDLYNPKIEKQTQMSINPELPEEGLNDAQIKELYNMLLANGVSHEEAINELLKY